ncbi:MAG: lysophospholipase [Planctomycetales bacterium]|nr:lysophospholipase [Planctomycetales bacterium]
MQFTQRWIETATGSKYMHLWEPENPQALVCLVHGLGEHGGRYHSLGNAFAEQRILTVAFDQQGHGKSPEMRGCIGSYEALLDDIQSFTAWAQSEFGLTPTLLGHSMGGNLVINLALRRPTSVSSCIASSPMIHAVRTPNRIFEAFAKILMRLAPNYRLHSEVEPAHLMSDPVEQKLLSDDELFHSQLSLRLGGALLDSGRWALANASRLSVPMLLSHGTNDSRTCPQASQMFASRAPDYCELAILQGMLHDPFRDLDRDRIIPKFVEFTMRCSRSIHSSTGAIL